MRSGEGVAQPADHRLVHALEHGDRLRLRDALRRDLAAPLELARARTGLAYLHRRAVVRHREGDVLRDRVAERPRLRIDRLESLLDRRIVPGVEQPDHPGAPALHLRLVETLEPARVAEVGDQLPDLLRRDLELLLHADAGHRFLLSRGRRAGRGWPTRIPPAAAGFKGRELL